jgi:hypothetical protein
MILYYHWHIHQLSKKTQKHANNQRGSSGSIPSIEITKENVESGDYISDESEYQEGGNGERSQRNSNSNGPPSPLSSYAQHQSPQQYHQPQVRWKCVARTQCSLLHSRTPTSDCLCI